MNRHTRRDFLQDVGRGMLVASVGSSAAFDMGLARGLAADAVATPRLNFGELEPLGSRCAAGGDEDPFTAGFFPGTGDHSGQPVVLGDRCRTVADDGDALGEEGFAQFGGELWFSVWGEPADDGDLDPEPGEELGLFDTDEAAADDHE